MEASAGAPRSHCWSRMRLSPLQVSQSPGTAQAQEYLSSWEAQLPTTYFTCKTPPGWQPLFPTHTPPGCPKLHTANAIPHPVSGGGQEGQEQGCLLWTREDRAWGDSGALLRQAGHSDTNMLHGHICSGFINFLLTLEFLLLLCKYLLAADSRNLFTSVPTSLSTHVRKQMRVLTGDRKNGETKLCLPL